MRRAKKTVPEPHKASPKLEILESRSSSAIAPVERFVQFTERGLQEEPSSIQYKLRPLPRNQYGLESENTIEQDIIRQRAAKVFHPERVSINPQAFSVEPSSIDLKLKPVLTADWTGAIETGNLEDAIRRLFSVNQMLKVGNILGAEQFLGRKLTSEEISNKSINDEFEGGPPPDHALEAQRHRLLLAQAKGYDYPKKPVESAQGQTTEAAIDEEEQKEAHTEPPNAGAIEVKEEKKEVEEEEEEGEEGNVEEDFETIVSGPGMTPIKVLKVTNQMAKNPELARIIQQRLDLIVQGSEVSPDPRLDAIHWRYIADQNHVSGVNKKQQIKTIIKKINAHTKAELLSSSSRPPTSATEDIFGTGIGGAIVDSFHKLKDIDYDHKIPARHWRTLAKNLGIEVKPSWSGHRIFEAIQSRITERRDLENMKAIQVEHRGDDLDFKSMQPAKFAAVGKILINLQKLNQRHQLMAYMAGSGTRNPLLPTETIDDQFIVALKHLISTGLPPHGFDH